MPERMVPNRNTKPKFVGNARSDARMRRSTKPAASASIPPIALRSAQNVPRRSWGTIFAVTSANGTPPTPPATALMVIITSTTATTRPGCRAASRSTAAVMAKSAMVRTVDVK